MKPLGKADKAKPEGERTKKLVLYVEDERLNREVAELRLGKKYDIICAKNDREACQLIRKHAHEIAIILMDIELQDSILNGVQLTRLLRGKPVDVPLPDYAKDLPVLSSPAIFVTAYGDQYKPEDLAAAGADKTIPKPVDFVELEMAMTKIHLQRMK